VMIYPIYDILISGELFAEDLNVKGTKGHSLSWRKSVKTRFTIISD